MDNINSDPDTTSAQSHCKRPSRIDQRKTVTELGTSESLTFDYDNPLLVLLAHTSIDSDNSGPRLRLNGGLKFVVNAAQIEILWSYGGDASPSTTTAFWVDGTQVTANVPAGSTSYYQQSYITIFDGADGTHTIDLIGSAFLGTTGIIRLTGSNPSLVAPFSPYGSGGYQVLDFTTLGSPNYVRFPKGTYTSLGNIPGGHSIGAGQSIRFHSKGGKAAFYGAYNPAYYHVYRDGTQLVNNAAVQYGAAAGAPYYVGSLDLGAPDTAFHDFEIVFPESGFTIQNLAVETATIDSFATISARPIAFIGGDSIRAGNSAGQTPTGDVTQYWVWQACRALGWDLCLYAIGGSKITDNGTGTAAFANAIAPFVTESVVPVLGEEAWGINDTQYPPLDSNGLYTSTDNTVAGRTQGAQYPGSGDQTIINTYKSSLQTYISQWFAAFPTTPLLIAELFRGGANDWLREFWMTNAQQPAITAFLASNPGKRVGVEITDAWYSGSDGLHPQVGSGASATIVPYAEVAWSNTLDSSSSSSESSESSDSSSSPSSHSSLSSNSSSSSSSSNSDQSSSSSSSAEPFTPQPAITRAYVSGQAGTNDNVLTQGSNFALEVAELGSDAIVTLYAGGWQVGSGQITGASEVTFTNMALPASVIDLNVVQTVDGLASVPSPALSVHVNSFTNAAPVLMPPSITPSGTANTVDITSPLADALIYYTVVPQGGPQPPFKLYTTPVSVSVTSVVKARQIYGRTKSAVASAVIHVPG